MSKTVAKKPLALPTRFSSASPLSERSRTRLTLALNERLLDGLDLQLQVKVAHWNVRGPQFVALHAFFDALATSLTGFNDQVAERSAALGGLALGTARQVAAHSRIAEFPLEVTRDLTIVAALVARLDTHIEGLRSTRTVAEEEGDVDTADLLTAQLAELEKTGWMMRATLDV